MAAANWQVTLIQAIADSLFKLLIAAPMVGGVFLVALVVGSEPRTLLALEWRELAATIVTSLMSRPLVLALFLAALGVVVAGGSLFVFLVKAGTVSTLVRGDRSAGAIERPPLHLEALAAASTFSIESFTESARSLFPRYARLGAALLVIYAASTALYLGVLFGGGVSWGLTAAVTALFVGWITILNLLYLLTQIVIAADDCGLAAAAARVAAFVRRELRHVAAVFLMVLALVVVATGASVLATGALSLIGFVPFFGPFLGLAVMPLSLLAWALRAIVFQYIGLASVVSYLTLYREADAFAAESTVVRTARQTP